MATVKIFYDKDATSLEAYLKVKRETEGPTTEQGVFLDTMTREFSGVQNIYGSKGNNALHLIQSWSPAESKTLSKEKIHSMGVDLVERFAPGHQYVIQTHMEEPHAHNHIVVNPVSIETGKRIHNKKQNLYNLRDLNDHISRENGLSVLPKQEPDMKRQGLTDKVKRIDNYRGRSYIADLANKADFARHYATNYDEYVALLNTLDIGVRIEPKNITYFYPGRTHGKRGSNLNPHLDKPSLERKFQTNRDAFERDPRLKANLAELGAKFRGGINLKSEAPTQATGADPLVSKRADVITQPRQSELDQSIIPICEIQNAKTQSIHRYCLKEGIKLAQNDEGKTVLMGREYIEVSEYTWSNQKNKTRGNLIDFVANHEDSSFIQAVAKINGNPKLLLLERYLGESKKQYQSFYFPKEDAAPRNEALLHLTKLFGHSSAHPMYSELFKQQKVHVAKNGSIFLLSTKESGNYVEYQPGLNGTYQTIRKGQPRSAFWNSKGKSRELELFTDPKTFLRSSYNGSNETHARGVAALFEPDLEIAHKVIADQPHLRKLILRVPEEERGSAQVAKLYNDLKDSLNPFSIDTELAWQPIGTHKHELRDRQSSIDLSL